jgi:dCTP deaminase
VGFGEEMILTDRNIRDLIEKKDGLLTGYDVPSDWDSKNSLVQPSSVDLHVGAIFRPGVKQGKPGSAGNPKYRISLKTGETAIVETKESINLPPNYAAFGFPPSSVSSLGLLMTNPGHVDPGYKGTLTFTVINMAREEFVLHPTLPIVTLLVFELAEKVGKDYGSRRAPAPNVTTKAPASGPQSSRVTQERIDLLSSDFVDVTRRAGKIARDVLGWAALAATLVAVVSTAVVNSVENRISKFDEMKTKLVQLDERNAKLEKDLQSTKTDLEKEINLDLRLAAIEQQMKAKGSLVAMKK